VFFNGLDRNEIKTVTAQVGCFISEMNSFKYSKYSSVSQPIWPYSRLFTTITWLVAQN